MHLAVAILITAVMLFLIHITVKNWEYLPVWLRASNIAIIVLDAGIAVMNFLKAFPS